jgi:hypothetical protein
MAILQVWSAPRCETGAVCLGVLSPWISATGSESAGTPDALRVVVSRDVADAAGAAEGRVLRVLSASRGEQWRFIASVTDSDGDASLVQLNAGPLRQLLTVRGLVRDGSQFSFTPGAQTVTELLTTYVLTNLADDGLSWLTLGTVDATAPIEIGNVTRVTRAAILDLIERQTGDTARLRDVYTGGVLTGVALDVVTDPAAGLDTVPLSSGAQVATIQRTRDALRAATVVVPFSASGAPMDDAVWLVDSISGSAPAWLILRDPVAGAPYPVREDGQFIGSFVRQRDGTQSAITDSRASDSAVEVASVGTITAGDEITITTTSGGATTLALASPSGLASSRGRLVGTVSTSVADHRRNLVQNGTVETWTTPNAAAGFETAGTTPSGQTMRIGQYPRTTPTSFSAQLSAALSPGTSYSQISVSGGGANALVLASEQLGVGTPGGTVQGVNVAGPDAVTVLDGSGAGTIPTVTFTAATGFPVGTAVNLISTAPTGRRIASFPDDGLGLVDVAAVFGTGDTLSTSVRVQSIPIALAFDPARPRLYAAAGVSERNLTASTVTASLRLLLLDTTSGTTVLGTATGDALAASATVHRVLQTSALLTASRTVTAGVTLVNRGEVTSFLRWLSLWVGPENDAPMAVQRGSGSNALWHRGQDVLASSALGVRYVVRGVDLTRLQQETGALALGQRVRLRSDTLGVNATVRIVKLDYDFGQTETLSLELGAITPRLTGVTVTL